MFLGKIGAGNGRIELLLASFDLYTEYARFCGRTRKSFRFRPLLLDGIRLAWTVASGYGRIRLRYFGLVEIARSIL